MARTRFLFSLLLISLFFGLVSTNASAQDTTPGDYTGFWYEENNEGEVSRVSMEGERYEDRRRSELQEWITMFRAFLAGEYEAYAEHPDRPITAEQAQNMVRLDETTQERIQTNPVYRDEMAKQMAEWSLYYEQLELWNRYVAQRVLRDSLSPDEKITHNPATIETDLELIYEALQAHAEEVIQEQRERQENMVARIENNRISKQQYENWLADREAEVLEYARRWARRREGSETEIEGTIYLVRKAEGEARAQEAVAEDTVILNVPPQQEELTPFDLLNEDGTLKKTE